ncbi:MAG: Molybdate-binding domain of ModE, partial [uncultured Nocardioides sp.]
AGEWRRDELPDRGGRRAPRRQRRHRAPVDRPWPAARAARRRAVPRRGRRPRRAGGITGRLPGPRAHARRVGERPQPPARHRHGGAQGRRDGAGRARVRALPHRVADEQRRRHRARARTRRARLRVRQVHQRGRGGPV